MSRFKWDTSHMEESCHTYESLSSSGWLIHTWHVSPLCDMAHSHCNTLHHIVTHCNTLQHTATHCNTRCNTLQHTATHCATHCNTTQRTATWPIHTWHGVFLHDTIHSYVTQLMHIRHDSLIYNMTHSYITWLIHIWHDSFMCDVPRSHVTWPIDMFRNIDIAVNMVLTHLLTRDI